MTPERASPPGGSRRWPGFLPGLRSSSMVRNVSLLASGTAAATVVTGFITPVLSRLYDPVDFGFLALYASIVSVLVEAASARYELTVVLPKADEDARDLLVLSLGTVGVVTLFSALLVAVGGRWFAHLLGSEGLAPYLWWVPPMVLVMGAFRSLANWATRHRRFGAVSVANVSRSIGLAVFQVGAGLLGAGAGGLIGGRFAGEAATALTLGAGLSRSGPPAGPLRAVVASVSPRRRVLALAREYEDFPRFNLPQSLLSAISQSVPTFLLSHYYDPAIVGIYAMSHRLLVLPTRVLSQSVRQVFYQRASELHAHGQPVARVFLRTTATLVAIVLVPTLVIVLFGPWLFSTVLGETWREAGEYARWLVIWLFFVYVNPPALSLMQVLRRNSYLLAYDASLLVARVAVLVWGGLHWSAVGTVIAFSIVGASWNALLILAVTLLSLRARSGAPGAERPGIDDLGCD